MRAYVLLSLLVQLAFAFRLPFPVNRAVPIDRYRRLSPKGNSKARDPLILTNDVLVDSGTPFFSRIFLFRYIFFSLYILSLSYISCSLILHRRWWLESRSGFIFLETSQPIVIISSRKEDVERRTIDRIDVGCSGKKRDSMENLWTKRPCTWL